MVSLTISNNASCTQSALKAIRQLYGVRQTCHKLMRYESSRICGVFICIYTINLIFANKVIGWNIWNYTWIECYIKHQIYLFKYVMCFSITNQDLFLVNIDDIDAPWCMDFLKSKLQWLLLFYNDIDPH